MRKKKTTNYLEIRNDPVLKQLYFEELEAHERWLDSVFYPLHERPTKPPFLVEDFLPQGYLTLLAGDPKVGKTCVATAIALAVATGQPFAGLQTIQSPVLWLSLEESPIERHSILENVVLPTFSEAFDGPEEDETPAPVSSQSPESPSDMSDPADSSTNNEPSSETAPPPNDASTTSSGRVGEVVDAPPPKKSPVPIFISYERIPIDTESGIEVLQHWVRKTGARLVVIDPLHGAHSGRSLQDGWAARKTLRLLKDFCSQSRITALVLHHLTTRGANKRVAESAQLSAVAGMFMLFTNIKSKTNDRLIHLETKGRGHFANNEWLFSSNGPLNYEIAEPPAVPEESPKPEPPRNPVEEAILTALAQYSPQSVSELAKSAAANPNTARHAVDRLYAKGELRLAYTQSGTRYFALPENELKK